MALLLAGVVAKLAEKSLAHLDCSSGRSVRERKEREIVRALDGSKNLHGNPIRQLNTTRVRNMGERVRGMRKTCRAAKSMRRDKRTRVTSIRQPLTIVKPF